MNALGALAAAEVSASGGVAGTGVVTGAAIVPGATAGAVVVAGATPAAGAGAEFIRPFCAAVDGGALGSIGCPGGVVTGGIVGAFTPGVTEPDI